MQRLVWRFINAFSLIRFSCAKRDFLVVNVCEEACICWWVGVLHAAFLLDSVGGYGYGGAGVIIRMTVHLAHLA